MIKYTSFKAIPQFTRAGSYAVDIPLDRVPKWVANEQEDPGLVLTPEFQRGHVWTKKQQVAYLEFLLRGGRTGRDLYFNYPSQHVQVPDGAYNDYVCVDGLQRLTAIQRFFGNELKAQWLGHSQLETTQIYAHADTEHKRKAIEAATPQDNPLYSKLNSARYTVTDEETLKKLTGLK